MKATETHIFFYGGMYSNFDKCHFTDPKTGYQFENTEQAFMWYKAEWFNDHVTADKIRKTTDPFAVKKLGREVQGFNDKSWDCVKFGFMVYVNYLKYTQNPFYGQALKLSYPKTLVEASPTDRVWGIGVAINDPLLLVPATWERNNVIGQNLLGKALMEVRKMLI